MVENVIQQGQDNIVWITPDINMSIIKYIRIKFYKQNFLLVKTEEDCLIKNNQIGIQLSANDTKSFSPGPFWINIELEAITGKIFTLPSKECFCVNQTTRRGPRETIIKQTKIKQNKISQEQIKQKLVYH